jgi:hypothetical protein
MGAGVIAMESSQRRRLFYCIDAYVNTAHHALVKAWSAAEIRARYPDLVVDEASIEDMSREDVLTIIDQQPKPIEWLMQNACDIDDLDARFLVDYDRHRGHWRGHPVEQEIATARVSAWRIQELAVRPRGPVARGMTGGQVTRNELVTVYEIDGEFARLRAGLRHGWIDLRHLRFDDSGVRVLDALAVSAQAGRPNELRTDSRREVRPGTL